MNGNQPWTEREERLLAANPTLCAKALSDLLAHIGPRRTPGAISKKRQSMKIARQRKASPTRALSVASAGGWPMVPPAQKADTIFVRALISAARSEGLLQVTA